MRELALIVALILPATAAPVKPGQPTPAPSPTSTARPLHEIGSVRAVTRFCQEFTTRFNNSARAMLDNDRELSYTYYTMGTLEDHYDAKHGNVEGTLYQDRINLLHFAGEIFKTLPGLQTEINAVRQSAALTTDPVKAQQARDVAAELQKSYDRQRALAVDSLSVAQAMAEVSSEHHPDPFQTPVYGGFDGANAAAPLPKAMRDVRTVLKFDTQLNRISDAESSAVTQAETVVSDC